jgi:hypothetical protein
MGKLLVQLGSSTNWETLYLGQWTAIPTLIGNKEHFPIPSQIIPILADRRILAAGAASLSTKPTWRTGGWLNARLKLPGALSFNPEVETFKLPLFGLKLIVLPDFGHSYQLEYRIPPWFKDAEVEIYQYIGPEGDSTDELIKNELIANGTPNAPDWIVW